MKSSPTLMMLRFSRIFQFDRNFFQVVEIPHFPARLSGRIRVGLTGIYYSPEFVGMAVSKFQFFETVFLLRRDFFSVNLLQFAYTASQSYNFVRSLEGWAWEGGGAGGWGACLKFLQGAS